MTAAVTGPVTGPALAQAAGALTGTPFRLGGRDPESGLDCLGVLGAAMAACGRPITLPTGYGLRVVRLAAWLPDPAGLGLVPGSPPIRPGDVLLLEPGPAQAHLVIAAAPGGFIHAHAGLRRVVHSPALPSGRVLGHWRLAASSF